MSNINDDIAGRFRKGGEYVRVGMHIAPAPEKVPMLIKDAITTYTSDHSVFFVDRIARFHLEFEHTHPFIDGNGRIGRVLINYQLAHLSFPNIIIRNKEKEFYYDAFRVHNIQQDSIDGMGRIIALAIIESLHKRIAHLKGREVMPLAEFAKAHKRSAASLLNAARRQTIPAFREKGKWMIGGNDEI